MNGCHLTVFIAKRHIDVVANPEIAICNPKIHKSQRIQKPIRAPQHHFFYFPRLSPARHSRHHLSTCRRTSSHFFRLSASYTTHDKLADPKHLSLYPLHRTTTLQDSLTSSSRKRACRQCWGNAGPSKRDRHAAAGRNTRSGRHRSLL